MEYRQLGSAGLCVSALSLGAWVTYGGQVGEETAAECMLAARQAGVNFFDNAEVYANGEAERVMGNVIRRLGWRRSDLVISTKIFWGGRGPNDRGLSRKHLVEGTRAALERLQMDYVDLLFCHRPDARTPVEETVRAMNWIIEQGWAFYWGTSEWDSRQIEEAYGIARRERLIPPQMEQPQYNMFHRARVEVELEPLTRRIGLGLTTWSPLASGLLSGKYNDGVPAGTRVSLPGYEWLRDQVVGPGARDKLAKTRALTPIAAELNCSLAQLAIAWCVRNPRVSSVITGASRPEQVVENMAALDVANRFTPSLLQSLENVLDNRPDTPTDHRG